MAALNLFDPGNRMDNAPLRLNNEAKTYAKEGTNFLAFNSVTPQPHTVYEFQKGGAPSYGYSTAERNRRMMQTQGEAMGSGGKESLKASVADQLSKDMGRGLIAPNAFTLEHVKPDLDDTFARKGVFAFRYNDVANPYVYGDKPWDLGGRDKFKYSRGLGHMSNEDEGPGASAEKMEAAKRRAGPSVGAQAAKRRPRQPFKPDTGALEALRPRSGAAPFKETAKGSKAQHGKNSAWRGGLEVGAPYNPDHMIYKPGYEQQKGMDERPERVVTSHHRRKFTDEKMRAADPQLLDASGGPFQDSTRVLWPGDMTQVGTLGGNAGGGGERKGEKMDGMASYVKDFRNYAARKYDDVKPKMFTGSAAGDALPSDPAERMGGSSSGSAPKTMPLGFSGLGVKPGFGTVPFGRGADTPWSDKSSANAYDHYGYQERATWLKRNSQPLDYTKYERNQFGEKEQMYGRKSKNERYTAVFDVADMECPPDQTLVNGQCIPAGGKTPPVCLPGWEFRDGKCQPQFPV